MLCFSYLSLTYFSFAITLSSISLPKSYRDAILDPRWRSAMDEEMTALHANETWELIFLSLEKQTVGCQ